MTIRVLVATARLQARHPHDHFGTNDGELVRLASYDPASSPPATTSSPDSTPTSPPRPRSSSIST